MPKELRSLADLHYEAYDAMLSIALHHEGIQKMPRDMYEKECDRYANAQKQIKSLAALHIQERQAIIQ